MFKKIIVVFIFVWAHLLGAGQTASNIKDTISKEQKRGEQELIKRYLEAFQKDSTQFQDRNGKISNAKVFVWMSREILSEEIGIYNEYAKILLDSLEYKHYKGMVLKVDSTSKLPVITLNDSVWFDKEWIVNYFIQSTLVFTSGLANDEYAYYLESSRIQDDVVPDYIGRLMDSFMTNQPFSVQMALLKSLEFFNLFVIMHEFYHSFYGSHSIDTSTIELRADSFAVVKCYKYFKASQKLMDSSSMKSINDKAGVNVFDTFKHVNNVCGVSANLFGKSVTFADFLISQFGSRFIEVLIKMHQNKVLTNPDELKTDMARATQLNNVFKKSLGCDVDSDNIFCCLNKMELKKIDSIKTFMAKLKGPGYYRDMPVSKGSFQILYPDDPSFVSFQLGNYYSHLRLYKKAFEYYASANLFEQTTKYQLLCNLLCGDLCSYVSSLNRKAQASIYYTKAKELNKSLKVVREEILPKE